ncbi:MAG: preprotein translocase subunit SecE [Oscillospiraceae bacterium]|jgi:preprotein translocase subunit SecE|nr:preprotein translocase subunit SecE [Oscillospiraceae bacterium]
MANLEKEYNKESKEKEREKRENQRNALKAAAAKRPKRSPMRFFKDAKAEFKKVVWPTPKQVLNNTGVVLTAIVITAAIIFGLDSLFALILEQAYSVNLR